MSYSSGVSGLGFHRVTQAIAYLKDLWMRREFAVALGLGNLRARNASTSLGLLWWILNPMLLGGVYFIVFGLIFGGRRPDDFLVYLLIGMFVFHFTSQSMTGGANAIIQNARLLANLRFPRLILPISALIESLVGFLASLVIVAIAVLVFGATLDPQSADLSLGVIPHLSFRLIYLPFIVGLQLLFNLGLGCITARLAVPFRDINNLLPYVNRIWLYLTPVIWPLSFLDEVSGPIQTLVRLNPMYDIVGVYRSIFFGAPIILDQVVGAIIWSIAIGVIGVAAFVRHEGHIVRHL